MSNRESADDLGRQGPGVVGNKLRSRGGAEMNNRPRKTLKWRSPAEALDKLLSEHDNNPGVAITA